ncbi:MAG: beta-CASP ribonuclease aCPSF1 [archaeon]|nr:beta-CASP ribonuclease aCPSF1 [archaeon]MCR4323676.1 beta-CASP ribonuclease aCPSF1 [Nanoarchaeota archaeon]
MADILKTIEDQLPKGTVSSTIFEGANIVVYTSDSAFLKNGDPAIKDVVNSIKKRVELRADKALLMSQEETEKRIREIIPVDAELTQIIFDPQRSIVVVEAKRPGIAIGKSGSVLKDIKMKTFWTPQVQRSAAIRSKITEKIREVLYQDNNYRKKFLNSIGEKVYKEWNPEKIESWVRITALGGARQVGRSCFLLQTPASKILIDCGIDVSSNGKDRYPYLEAPELDLASVDAIVLSHAHLDHSGLIPYIYKMGYKGPVYMTPPTRDISALMALDFIGVAYKQAAAPLFKSTDIRNMVKHSVSLNYNEVTDITPDVRITFYNAGHVLGSAMIHFNIGNGLHNYIYSGDIKFGKSRLLEPAATYFPRLETLQLESTYGGKDSNYPSRKESEQELLDFINTVISKGGKVLLPELGTGHAQEKMLLLDDAMKTGKIPKVPVYIDGLIWDISAVHTAYPDFLSNSVRSLIFADKNPFTSDTFQRVGSPLERKNVIEGGPCIVLATSGMLVGGASVEYLKEFAESSNNGLCLSCYQPAGGLGRQIKEGLKEAIFNVNGRDEKVSINLKFLAIDGFSGHSSRNELMAFVNMINPKPRRIIINHGEQSKSLDLASSIHKSYRIETLVPKNLETIRLR